MPIIEQILADYDSLLFGSLVADSLIFAGEHIYNQEDGIYATILAHMLKRKEIEELSLIEQMITCVEVIPDWDLARYDQMLVDKENELLLVPEETLVQEKEKIYYKKPLMTISEGEI